MSGDEEPEYVIVQPGLDGVAWLGEVIDGELAPIGKVGDILDEAARAHEFSAEAHNTGHDYDRRGERLWRLAALAGWQPGNPADNDATAEMYVRDALVDRMALIAAAEQRGRETALREAEQIARAAEDEWTEKFDGPQGDVPRIVWHACADAADTIATRIRERA